MSMKRAFSVGIAALLLICMLGQACLAEEPLVINIYRYPVEEMPSLRRIVLQDPVSEEILEDRTVQLTFEGITQDDLNAFISCLADFGCTLEDDSATGSVLTMTATKDDASIGLVYDAAAEQAIVTYPVGTVEKKTDVAAIRTMIGLQPGDLFLFGSYPQTGDDDPVLWLVLEVRGSRALLVSWYGLDAGLYNTWQMDVTWENCTLRQWLNDDFIAQAFDEDERDQIMTVTVDNSQSQGYWNTDGGNDTRDKVFLLSYAEANKYFGVTYGGGENVQARVAPTDYARNHGVQAFSSYQTENGKDAAVWMLRSPGMSASAVARVSGAGSLINGGVSSERVVIRPAMWIDLANWY